MALASSRCRVHSPLCLAQSAAWHSGEQSAGGVRGAQGIQLPAISALTHPPVWRSGRRNRGCAALHARRRAAPLPSYSHDATWQRPQYQPLEELGNRYSLHLSQNRISPAGEQAAAAAAAGTGWGQARRCRQQWRRRRQMLVCGGRLHSHNFVQATLLALQPRLANVDSRCAQRG